MTCTLRYWRPGLDEPAGFLIIANESELPAYKARLEAAGYVVLEAPAAPPLVVLRAKSP